MTAPPFAYFGGKTLLADRIAAVFPAHRHYVEPYAGGLSVLLAMRPSVMETVNDLDQALVTFWRVLRDRPAELARVCQLTPHSAAEYAACSEVDDVADDLERARRVWVRISQGRTGRLVRTGWRHYVDPGATGTAFPTYLDGYVDRMAAIAARLHHVTLECKPALDIISKYGKHRDVLLYVDPPYLGRTRGSYDNAYRHEMRDEESHRELAAALHASRSAVVLSGYPSDLYDLELYPDWHRHAMVSGTGQGAQGWSNRTEVLWSNRPLMQDFDLWTAQ